MSDLHDKDSWSSYSKLVLDYLDRLDENYNELYEELDDVKKQLNEFKTVEKSVGEHKSYIDKVTEVWSTTQMKEAKDEIYKHKTKLDIAVAIVAFIQILVGIGVYIFKNAH
jgi:regulator of replication initiation timing